MKEKNRTWGKWYLKGLAFLATGIFTSMAAGLSVMAQTELTFTEKLTIEEVRELSEPEKEYEDENGIRYELKHWELQEKEGEESTRTLEKRVEYPKVEAAEEVGSCFPEIYTEKMLRSQGSSGRKIFQYLLHFIPMGQMNMNWEIL